MEARDYFNRGEEYFDNEDYDQAVEEFLKALEMIMGPDKDGVMQKQLEEHGSEPFAIFLRGFVEQNL
jgi:tetratricopeptide (TPR) repeat protein